MVSWQGNHGYTKPTCTSFTCLGATFRGGFTHATDRDHGENVIRRRIQIGDGQFLGLAVGDARLILGQSTLLRVGHTEGAKLPNYLAPWKA